MYHDRSFFYDYRVIGIYMIVDKNELFNEHIVKQRNKPELMYNIRKKFELFRFFITVNILHKIVIEMNDLKTHRFVVFDGPGLLFDTLSETNQYIVTSTFQCMILLLTPNNNLSYEGYFIFTSKLQSIFTQKYISQTNKQMYYPNEECTGGLCISSFSANEGYQINITTTSVKSTMSTYFNSLYAGFYAGEGLTSEFIETKKLSGNYDGQDISFYSNNSSMIIFMYWYEGISEINASVVLSQTKCKAVFVDPKRMSLLAPISFVEPNFEYLQNIFKFSGVDMAFHNDNIEYALSTINCTIILINTRYRYKFTLIPRHAVDNNNNNNNKRFILCS